MRFIAPGLKTKSSEPTPIQAMSHGPSIPGIPSFETLEEKRQWQLEHLAGAFRIFAHHGYAEGLSGHISVRDPIHADAFWMNPLGVHFGMLKASDMILVNLDGKIMFSSRKTRPDTAAGFLIHAAIIKLALTSMQFATRILHMGGHAVYKQYGGLVLGEEEGVKMAQVLGPPGKGCVLMNHGLLTVGAAVDEAAYMFRSLEKSCECQMLADAAAANGISKHIIDD